MVTKEQELTFENIDEFFSIAEEIVNVVSNSIDKLDQGELIYRLDMVESFIEQILSCSEIITDDYTRLVNSDVYDKEYKEEIQQQVVLMIVTLNNCREQLLSRLGDE